MGELEKESQAATLHYTDEELAQLETFIAAQFRRFSQVLHEIISQISMWIWRWFPLRSFGLIRRWSPWEWAPTTCNCPQNLRPIGWKPQTFVCACRRTGRCKAAKSASGGRWHGSNTSPGCHSLPGAGWAITTPFKTMPSGLSFQKTVP